jgi:hypothetical protein
MTPVYDADGFLIGFLEEGGLEGEGPTSFGQVLSGLLLLAVIIA